MNKSVVAIGVVVVIILAVAAGVYVTMNKGSLLYGGSASVPVLLTDPPQVPNGTSALLITYSSLQVHTEGTSGSGWVSAGGSGTINLMSAVNSSQIIGFASLNANSVVNLARFNIESAQITINGTTYNVTVPNSNLTVAITGENKLGANSAVLIDIMPVVTAVFSNNSTRFVMAPAARAMVLSNSRVSSDNRVGDHIELNVTERDDLEALSPNLTIQSASVYSADNVTYISVTVKDNSNTSATINYLTLFGPQNVSVSGSAGINTIARSGIEGGLREGDLPVNLNGSASDALDTGLQIQHLSAMFFIITQNGSLMLPNFDSFDGSIGDTIGAGGTATLTFAGKVSYNNGFFQTNLVNGAQYRVVVAGEENARASANVTAT